MESTVKTLSETTREVSVTVPADEVSEAIEKAYRQLNKRVKLQGFRKGKAPRQMLESLYKREVEQEVAEDIVGSSLQQAAVEHRLEAVGRPTIEGAELSVGEPLTFTATVQVIPEFELHSLEGERLEKRIARVSEEDLEEQLGHLAEQFASFEASEEEPLAEGDYAIIDFGRMEGDSVAEEGAVGAYPLILGEGALHPAFEERLVGARRGEARDVTVPAGEGMDEERSFRVTVQEVKKRRVPAVDDDLARTVGEESLESLKATLKKEMERHEESRAQERLRNDLTRRLVELHPVAVPDALIEHAMNRLLGDLQRSLAARGHRMDSSQIDAEKLSDRLREPAVEMATGDLILDKLASERGLEPAEAEVRAEVARMARQLDKAPAALHKEMESEGTLEGLRLQMRRRMALDALISELPVEERTVDRKEVEEKPPK